MNNEESTEGSMRDKIISILEQVYGEIIVKLDSYEYPLSHEVADNILAIFEEAIPKEKDLNDSYFEDLEPRIQYNQAIAEMKAKVKEGR